MPALVNIKVGSFLGTSDEEGTTSWPLRAKYCRKFARISLTPLINPKPPPTVLRLLEEGARNANRGGPNRRLPESRHVLRTLMGRLDRRLRPEPPKSRQPDVPHVRHP